MKYIDGVRTETQDIRDGVPVWSVSVLADGERFPQRVSVASKSLPNIPFGRVVLFEEAECSVAWARAEDFILPLGEADGSDFE